MAFKIVTGVPTGKSPLDDVVYRQQAAARARQDKSDDYKTTEIEIEAGPKDGQGRRRRTKVKLKYALDGYFVFAVYGENKDFHSLDREEWDAVAKNAIEKFAATGGHQIKLGPRAEDHNRYNFMAEFTRPVEMKPETVELFRRQRAESDAEELIATKQRELRALLGVQEGSRA